MIDLDLDSNFARLPTGLRLAFCEDRPEAQGAAPTLLLLHGVTDSHRSFDLLRPHLPRAAHVVALTLRGHGESDKPAGGYQVQDMARDAAAFLERQRIARTVIVGHSMGAAVAHHVAVLAPERVAGLALVGAFADFAGNEGVLDLIAQTRALGDPLDPAFVRGFQESCVARPAPQAFMDQVVRESLKAPARVWRDAIAALPLARLAEARARIEAPALIIWGERDAFCPEADQAVLRAELAGAAFVRMRGVGHTPHWEAPAETAAAIAGFWAVRR